MSRKKATSITPDEEALLERLEAGEEYKVVGDTLGVSADEIRNRVLKILNKVDKGELLKRFPIVFANSEGLEGLDPGKDVIKIARDNGMPKRMVEGIRRRVMARQGMSTDGVAALTDRALVATLREKLALSLQYIDPFGLAGAPVKDIEAVVDGLIKNIQLLEGKPTSITSHEDRRQMNELLPLLIKEAQRRGVTIDVTPERLTPITVVSEVTDDGNQKTE